jgi:hypothetical protein
VLGLRPTWLSVAYLATTLGALGAAIVLAAAGTSWQPVALLALITAAALPGDRVRVAPWLWLPVTLPLLGFAWLVSRSSRRAGTGRTLASKEPPP